MSAPSLGAVCWLQEKGLWPWDLPGAPGEAGLCGTAGPEGWPCPVPQGTLRLRVLPQPTGPSVPPARAPCAPSSLLSDNQTSGVHHNFCQRDGHLRYYAAPYLFLVPFKGRSVSGHLGETRKSDRKHPVLFENLV